MSTPPNPPSGASRGRVESSSGLVGLIPAAGAARRLGPLPCSKELLPIAVAGSGVSGSAEGSSGDRATPRIRVVAERLLAAFGHAGVERALLVIDRDKMDVPRYFAGPAGPPELSHRDGRGGRAAPMALAFVPVTRSPSVPHSLAAALPFVGEAPAALGFPDVLFTPENAFARIDDHRRQSGAALVLGLFPAPDPRTTDMVEVAQGGRVLRIDVRPRRSGLTLNWLIAVWDRRFTAWLTRRLAHPEAAAGGGGAGELQLGALFSEALADGVPIEGVPFPDGAYLDVGTPEGYARALGVTASVGADPGR